MKSETDERTASEVAMVAGVIRVMAAVVQTVKEFGRAPESAVFLAVQSKGLGLEGYERMKAMLVRTGLVKVVGHEFVWTGDDKSN